MFGPRLVSGNSYRPGNLCQARLDHLEWRAERGVEQYGYAVRFRSNALEGLRWACRALPPGMTESERSHPDTVYSIWVPRPRSGHVREQVLIYRDGALLARSPEPGPAIARLEEDLHRSLALHARDRIFIHAGVVAVNGRALLLPGASFAGKSTLVAALVRAGAHYYSDEYAVINPDGCVEPFARQLRLREPVRAPEISPGGFAPSQALMPGWVLFTSFAAGAGWTPQEISPGSAAIRLLSHTVAARLRSGDALAAARKVAERARCWEGPRGEAAPTAQLILRALTGEPVRIKHQRKTGR